MIILTSNLTSNRGGRDPDVGGTNIMAEISMSRIHECTPKFDSPIFCETFAKIRMEKFEKLKKKKHVLLEDYQVLKLTDYLACEEPAIQDNS